MMGGGGRGGGHLYMKVDIILIKQNHVIRVVFVSPELSSVRDYVITHSVRNVRSMYVVCSMYFAKLITVSTYIDVLSWDLDTMILG